MVKFDEKSVFRTKNKLQNQPAFLDRLAVLLLEGYTFYDGIMLLLPHHMKKYESTLVVIHKDLKDGLGVTSILKRLGFTSNILLPVAIAELDGRLALAIKGMALRLRRKEEKQKKLKNLLAYPIILFVFISVLLIAFRHFFLPNMEMLAFTRPGESRGFISLLPTIVTKIPDVVVLFVMIMASLTSIAVLMYKKFEPKTKIRTVISLPVIGALFSMIKTRDFASEFGSLLESGLSMQDALDVLVNQQLDEVLSEIAGNVRKLVIFGEPFDVATQLTEGLTSQLAAFARHGADSGYLSKELLIYSEHLREEIDSKIAKALAMLQPALFCIIAVCILAAYLALLLPIYGMMDKL